MANSEDDLIARIAIDGRKALKDAADVIREIEGMFRRGKFELGGGRGGVGGAASGSRRRSGGGTGAAAAVQEDNSILRRQNQELRSQLKKVVSAHLEFDQHMERVKRARANRQRVFMSRFRRNERGEEFNPLMPFISAGFGGSLKNPQMRKAMNSYKNEQRDVAAERRKAERQAERDRKNAEAESKRNMAAAQRRGILGMQWEIGEGQRRQREAEKIQRDNQRRGLRDMHRDIGRGVKDQSAENSAQEKAARDAERTKRDNQRRGLRDMHRDIGRGEKDRRDEERDERRKKAQEKRDQRETEKKLRAGGRQLQSMILNPDFRDMKDEVRRSKDMQQRRLGRQEQARRSEYLSGEARAGRGRGADFYGPPPPNYVPPDNKPRQRQISEMFQNAGVYRAKDMQEKNRFGKSSGKFGMGLYQTQQMFEDYQYAGIRGMSNNLAFMGAQVGGPAGWGIIGAAFALQLADLTYKMLGYADAEERAREEGERLAENQLDLIDIQAKAAAAFASARVESKKAIENRFEPEESKKSREKLIGAEDKLPLESARMGMEAIARDVQANPDKYIEAGFAANISDFPGMKETIKQKKGSLADAESALKLFDEVVAAENDVNTPRPQRSDFLGNINPEDARNNKLRKDVLARKRKDLADVLGRTNPEIAKLFGDGKDLTGRFYGNSETGTMLRDTLEQTVKGSKSDIFKKEQEFKTAKERMTGYADSQSVAELVYEKRLKGDKQAHDLSEPVLAASKEYTAERDKQVAKSKDLETSQKNISNWEDLIAGNTKARREQVDLIEKAERGIESSLRGQLSHAESMVQKLKTQRGNLLEAKTRSSDNYGANSFEIMRKRSRDFMEKAKAPEWMIQQRDDQMVGNRIGALRSSADAAGKAGNYERQIEVLSQLQELQLQMAGSDDRMGVAGGFLNASADVQREIEASYEKQAQAVQAQQNNWQGVVTALQQAEAIKLDPLSPDAIPKMQQYLALAQQAAMLLAQLDAQAGKEMNAGLATGAADTQKVIDYRQAQWDLFGGFSSGGSVPGRGNGDTVPAMLTPKEFVIRAPVVKKLGPDFFEQLNRTGEIPGFAGGGMVDDWIGGHTNRLQKFWAKYESGRRRREIQREIQRNMGSRASTPAPKRVSQPEQQAEVQSELMQRRWRDREMQRRGMEQAIANNEKRKAYQDVLKPTAPGVEGWGDRGRFLAKDEQEKQRVKALQEARALRQLKAMEKNAGQKTVQKNQPSHPANKPARKPRAPRNYNQGYAGFGGYGGYGGYGYDNPYGMGDLSAMDMSGAMPLYLIGVENVTGYTYDTPAYKRWSSPTSPYSNNFGRRFRGAYMNNIGQRMRGSMRGTSKRGFHAFSEGGIVPPVTAAMQSPMTMIMQMMTEKMGMTSGGSVTNYGGTTNNSNFRNLTINVQSPTGIQQIVDKVRQAQNHERRRQGR